MGLTGFKTKWPSSIPTKVMLSLTAAIRWDDESRKVVKILWLYFGKLSCFLVDLQVIHISYFLFQINYDYLVVAVGLQLDYHKVKGKCVNGTWKLVFVVLKPSVWQIWFRNRFCILCVWRTVTVDDQIFAFCHMFLVMDVLVFISHWITIFLRSKVLQKLWKMTPVFAPTTPPSTYWRRIRPWRTSRVATHCSLIRTVPSSVPARHRKSCICLMTIWGP